MDNKRKCVCLQSDIQFISADFTIYTLSIRTLTYTVSSPLGENSESEHIAAAMANHYNLAVSFHQVPITAGLIEAA